uniref:Uncharacterized protein n=1 Tax=Serinus canaria TaxID=9135 RepID=A0A8C9MY39_SERCA
MKLVAIKVTSLLVPKSESVAFTLVTSVPTPALSGSCTLYTDWLNWGALSLVSSTVITSSIVPVRDGRPPSLAVSTNRCTGMISRSRGFVKTSSGTIFRSFDFCKSRENCSLGLSV